MSDSSIESFRFTESIANSIKAVEQAAERMKLKACKRAETIGEVKLIYKEKLNLLSTNWPITFEVVITQVKPEEVALSVMASCKMFSITQDANNRKKAAQLLEMTRILIA